MPALRSTLSALLVLIGLLLGAFAVPASWAQSHLLDTDAWTEAVGPLIREEPVRDAVSGALVRAVDRDDRLPAAATSLLTRITDEVVATDSFARVWTEAVRISHVQLVEAVRDEGTGLSLDRGAVTVDVKTLFESLAPRLGAAGVPFVDTLPAPEGEIVLEDSPEVVRALEAAGTVDEWARPAAIGAVVALLLGVLLSRRPGHVLAAVGALVAVAGFVGALVWRRLLDEVGSAVDPVGTLVVQALTASVDDWLFRLGVVGVAAAVVGLLITLLPGRRAA